jgi:TolB-like protein/Flp pilus assembly protein TadD
MSESGKAVFLSYASQDAEAAKRIADALRAAGVEVWFDAEGGLEHGDEWDRKIRRQIKECVLFIAVISANTQAREEGYFRIEWELAAQRALGIAAGVAFILPVVIDDTKEPAALVPDRFRSVQWTRLRNGEIPSEVLQRFLKLWSHRRGMLKPENGDPVGAALRRDGSEESRHKAAPSKRVSWLVPLGAALLVAAGLVFWRVSPKPDATPPVAPPSAARQLATQARGLLAAGRVIGRETLTAADDLAEQAVKLDPTDAEVIATGAQVDAFMVYRGFDISERRRQSAAKRAQRALALAPGSFEARHAQAVVAGFLSEAPEMLAEAEHIYRQLWQERPGDNVLGQELGRVLQDEYHFADAAAVFLRAQQPLDAGWAYYLGGQFQDADKVADRLLAEKRDPLTFVLKANVALFGFGDMVAAQAAVGQLTPTELLNDDATGIAARLAVVQRDAPRILQLLGAFANPFISIGGVNYPRQYWTGYAQQMLDHPDAARSEWRGALQAVEERLRSNSADAESLGWAAVLRAMLGEKEAAGQALRLYLNYRPRTPGRWDWWEGLTILHLGGRNDEVLDMLAGELRRPSGHRMLYLFARSCPEFDPLRADPRLEALLRDTLPAGMKPFTATADQSVDAKADEKSVAVLAFANLSDDKANEYFSDGISEDLMNVLGKVPGLRVAARVSAFYFKDKNATTQDIGRKLGVSYLVDGSVQRAEATVRVVARLSRADTGEQVWSDKFDGEVKNIFALQDEIAGKIAENLRLKLGAVPRAERAVNPEAYRLYLLGRHQWEINSEAGTNRAVQYFNQAIQLDASFTLAYCGLADTYNYFGGFTMPGREAWEKELATARKALELDPGLADAHISVGIGLINSFRLRDAAQTYQRALKLNPNAPLAYDGLAYMRLVAGRCDEAVAESRKSVKLDPLSEWMNGDLAIFLYCDRQFEEAKLEAHRVLELNPDSAWGHQILGYAALAEGQPDVAVAQLQAALRLDPSPTTQGDLGHAYAVSGHRAEAEDILNRMVTLAKERYVTPSVWMKVYLGLGEMDRAFLWLEKCCDAQDPVCWLINADPRYDRLRRDLRCRPLLIRAGLTDEQLQ